MDLPYAPRPGQMDLVHAITGTQRKGGHLLVEAGTGTGKTIAALTASLAQNDRRVVWVTRTNSQQTQVLREHQALGGAGGLVVPFMGRRQYCPLLMQDPRFREGTPEELGRLCRDAKQKARQEVSTGRQVDGACPYFARLLEDGAEPVAAMLEGGVADAAELGRRVSEAGSCPYEALKALLPRARVVVAPSVFVVDDRLRRALLEWMGVGADACHLVVDEAHHLPAAARDHHSPRLGVHTLKRAVKEAAEFQDPVLAGKLLTSSLLDALQRVLWGLVDEFVHGEEDGLLPPGQLEEALMTELRLPSTVLRHAALDLEHWGEVVREAKRAKGRLPRSHLGAIGAFLSFWQDGMDEAYVQLVTAGERPAVEAALLDPAAVLGWLEEFWSSVHMSGTLCPLEEHRDLCGLRAPRMLVLPTPFDPGHLALYGQEGLRRSHQAMQRDPDLVARQQAAARELIGAWRGRIGLFFPSHQMLGDYLEEGFLHGVEASVHVERPGMSMPELEGLVQAFRRDPSPRALLLGVLGGRLTEGIDYPGDAMEHMVVFGIPYPRPTARVQALIHHFDRRHGQGWRYAVHNPTARVLRQAIGRLIRGPDDQGTAVVLDDRVVRFRALLPHLEMIGAPSEARPPGTARRRTEGFGLATDYLSRARNNMDHTKRNS